MIAVVSISFILISARGHSEQMSLDECIDYAKKNSPYLKASFQKVSSAGFSVKEAESGKKPRFTLSETVTSTDNPTYSFMSVLDQQRFEPSMMATINDPGSTVNFNTKLKLEQSLYTGGYLKSGINAAKLAGEAAGYEYDREIRSHVIKIKESFIRINTTKSTLSTVEKSIETAKAYSELARNLFEGGLTVESDYLSAQVRLQELNEMRINLRNGVELSLAGLQMLIGREYQGDFDISVYETDDMKEVKNIEYYLESATSNRTDLKSLDKAIEAKKAQVKMERASRKPGIGAFAEMNLNNSAFADNDGESWFAGVSVSYPLSDGGYSGSRISRSEAGLSELEWNRTQLKQMVELEVRQSYLNMQAAKARVESAEKAVLNAEESYRITRNRYENELAINVEMLNGERNLTDAKTRLLNAGMEYWLSLERLLYVAGL